MANNRGDEIGVGEPVRLVRPYRSTYRDKISYITYMQTEFPDGECWEVIGNGIVESVQAGVGITIDNTDPNNPVINATSSVTGDKNYVHTQIAPSMYWTVVHNLNKKPSVTIVTSAGDEVEGDVKHIDSNNILITFTAIFAGKAFIN